MSASAMRPQALRDREFTTSDEPQGLFRNADSVSRAAPDLSSLRGRGFADLP